MKKLALTTFFAAALFSAPAYAAKPLFFGYGDHIKKVAELPNINELHTNKGYLDVGYCYSQLSIVFIPVWNWNERYCGYVSSDTYTDASKEDLLEISKVLNADTSWDDGKSKLSMWERVWGKVVFGVVLLLIILFNLGKKNSE